MESLHAGPWQAIQLFGTPLMPGREKTPFGTSACWAAARRRVRTAQKEAHPAADAILADTDHLPVERIMLTDSALEGTPSGRRPSSSANEWTVSQCSACACPAQSPEAVFGSRLRVQLHALAPAGIVYTSHVVQPFSHAGAADVETACYTRTEARRVTCRSYSSFTSLVHKQLRSTREQFDGKGLVRRGLPG